MRVLFINHTGKVSGAERVLLSVLERLDGFTVRLLCPPGNLREGAERLGVPCEHLDELQARFTWRPDRLIEYLGSFRTVSQQIRAAVTQWQPDLIHANTVRAGIAATLATIGMNVKVVWHVHDILPHHPLSTFIRLLFDSSSRNYAICVSNATARRFRGLLLRTHSVRRRIHVLHNGIDPSVYTPLSSGAALEVPDIRGDFGLARDSFIVAIVGQLTPRKGQLELIEAFPAILSSVPRAVLLVVGAAVFNRDSEYRVRMEQAIATRGLERKVLLVGQRNNMPAVLRSVDALVVNSLEEPFGMVVLEAMASARPVIATNVGGVPEIIHDRRNGLLYEPGDYPLLGRHLNELAESAGLRERLGEDARETVASRFTTAIQVSQLLRIYRRIVEDSTVEPASAVSAVGENV